MSRGCKQIIHSYDIYKVYKKTIEGAQTYTVFAKVINSFCKKFKQELFNGSILTIPGNLGRIYIRKRKLEFFFKDNGEIDPRQSRASIDYGKTNKLWKARPDLYKKKYIYHTNEHTNGYRYKAKWLKPRINNISIINLSPMRAFKRDLNKFIRENFGKTDYYSEIC